MSATADHCTEQAQQALDRANEIRCARAALKRRIATGEITVARVILECPPEVDSWAIGDALMAQRRWGRFRAMKFLARLAVVETKPVGKLTERQKGLLTAALGRLAGGHSTAAGEQGGAGPADKREREGTGR